MNSAGTYHALMATTLSGPEKAGAPPARVTPWTIAWAVLRSVRPRQAAKNGLVLVPLFFTVNRWWDLDDIAGMATLAGRSIAALLLFTALSGAVYLVNDILDIKYDRMHPVKRNRPIAAGVLPAGIAWVAAAALTGGALSLSFLISPEFGFAALAYAALNFAYSLVVKHIVILDVMSVAAGFVLRAVAGSLAIDGTVLHRGGVDAPLDVTISPWLYLVTALGALFIALAKRRSELVAAGESSTGQRTILAEYSVGLLDQMIAIVAPATLIAYTLYTFGGAGASPNVPDNNSMMLTVPFVAYGLFRYLYLLHRHNRGEAPEEILLSDRPLLLNILLWLLTGAGVLLGNQLLD
jgi:4-hydroxybenzoate polyprenyltransferase